MAERRKAGKPLTRAEIGVLLAYAKIVLFDDLLDAGVLDDPGARGRVFRLFPGRDARRYRRRDRRPSPAARDRRHPLANAMINAGGPTYPTRMAERTAPTSPVMRAPTWRCARASASPRSRASRRARQSRLRRRQLASIASSRISRSPRPSGSCATFPSMAASRRWRKGTAPRLRPSRTGCRRAPRQTSPPTSPRAPGLCIRPVVGEGLATRSRPPADARRRAGNSAGRRGRRCAAAARRRRLFCAWRAPPCRPIETPAQAIVVTDYYDGLALDRALATLNEAQRRIATSRRSRRCRS